MKKIPKIQKKTGHFAVGVGSVSTIRLVATFWNKDCGSSLGFESEKKRASPIYIIYSQKIARVKGTVYILKLVWNEFISVVFSH